MSPFPAATAGAISVLVADSNRMQAQLLTNSLRRGQEFRLKICAMENAAIEAAVASTPPLVTLLSPNTSTSFSETLVVLRQFHLSHPEVLKVLLLEASDREMVVSAFRSGARGLFCLYQSNLRMLRKCIHSVAEGQVWANTQQLNYVFDLVTDGPAVRLFDSRGDALLSPREEQVVALVAEGLCNRDIAAQLALSEHTVKKYLFRIFEKLGISTRVELVLYAVHHGANGRRLLSAEDTRFRDNSPLPL